jgi:hypothetical protein
MNTFSELKQSILADGVIDKAEVAQLRELLYVDGKINKEAVEFLFELNDAVSGKFNVFLWEVFFVEVVTEFLLENGATPGEINDEEAEWLLSKIRGDKQLDKAERALLNNVKQKATKLPDVLKGSFLFLNILK